MNDMAPDIAIDTQSLNDSISGYAVLINASISTWAATAPDKALAAEVAGMHGASPEAVKVTRKLMAGANSELEEVLTAQRAVRTYLYAHSLPWSTAGEGTAKRGPRLVSVASSVEVLGKLGDLTTEFKSKLAAFKLVYSHRIQEALSAQGNMTNADEYPTPELLEDMFDVRVDVTPCPAVSDFSRMAIPAELAQALGNKMAKRQSVAVENAMVDLHARIAKAVSNMAVQLGRQAQGEKTRLYASLVDNVKELAGLVKDHNFANDEQLATLGQQLEDLSRYDIKQIKNSNSLAAELARKAAALSSAAASRQTNAAVFEVDEVPTAPAGWDVAQTSYDDTGDMLADLDAYVVTPVVTPVSDDKDLEDVLMPDGSTLKLSSSVEEDDFDLDSLLDS